MKLVLFRHKHVILSRKDAYTRPLPSALRRRYGDSLIDCSPPPVSRGIMSDEEHSADENMKKEKNGPSTGKEDTVNEQASRVTLTLAK